MPTPRRLSGSDGDLATIFASGGSREFGFERRRLHGGRSEGVEQVDLYCSPLRVSLLPTRGMGIWNIQWGETLFGWRSPVAGPVHPSFVPLFDPGGLGWLEGFDELLARCGLFSNGAPEFDADGRLLYPLHGRIANLPAESVQIELDEQAQSIVARGTVIESRFHFQKLRLTSTCRCRYGAPRIWIEDCIENLSEVEATVQILYHFNFGPPLLGEGARLICPAAEVAPRDVAAANARESWDVCPSPTPGAVEHVYFARLRADPDHQTSILLTNAQRDLAARLVYDVRQLPCFTFWKNPVGERDGYVVGLEPATNYPNIRSFEASRGRVIRLGPGESHDVQIELELCVGADAVAQGIAKIAPLLLESPHLISWPSPTYSPPADLAEEAG
jgi:hypothetical protein